MSLNIQKAKQAGYSDDEINHYLASQQPAKPAPQPQKKGSILDGLFPFIGGVGGSLLGAPLGPAGIIGGGAAGSGLGELIKQLIGGKGVDVGDVGKEAAIGGAGGVAGEVLSPILRGGLGLFSKGASSALDKAGKGFIGSQYNLSRPLNRATKLGDTVDALGKYGITNINDVIPAAEKVTGANGTITKGIRTAISGSSHVDTTGIAEMAKTIAANPSIPAEQDKKFIDFVNQGLQTIYGGRKGSLATEADPATTFDFIQQLESHAADLTKGKSPALITSEDKALKNGYRMLADELKQRLFEGVKADGTRTLGADRAIAEGIFSPEQLQELHTIHPELANDIANAKTAGELRKIASHFVKGSQAAYETDAASQLGFNNVGGSVKGVGRLIQNPLNLLAVPLGSDTVNASVGGAARGAAKKIGAMPTPGIARLLSVLTGQGGAQAASASPTDNSQAIEGEIIPQPGQAQNSLTTGATEPGQNPKEQVLRQILGQIMFSKAKNVSDIKAAYDFINPQSAKKPLTDPQRKTVASAQSGLRALDNAEAILKQDNLATIKAKIPIVSGQSPYATAAREIKDVLTRLRTGAALNMDEQKFYEQQLPQPFDSEKTINYKISVFRNLFETLAQQGGQADNGSQANDMFSLFQ